MTQVASLMTQRLVAALAEFESVTCGSGAVVAAQPSAGKHLAEQFEMTFWTLA